MTDEKLSKAIKQLRSVHATDPRDMTANEWYAVRDLLKVLDTATEKEAPGGEQEMTVTVRWEGRTYKLKSDEVGYDCAVYSGGRHALCRFRGCKCPCHPKVEKA